jgi:hypothetical protein
MTLRQKVARFKRQLRKDPHLCCPRLDLENVTPERVADHKHTTRAWDIARIELKLVTPLDVSRENSAISIPAGFRPRILHFPKHAPATRTQRV